MTCSRCNRVLSFSGKTSDLCFMSMAAGLNHDGYVLGGVNLGGGDYLEGSVCLECGQLQGEWPVPNPESERERDY